MHSPCSVAGATAIRSRPGSSGRWTRCPGPTGRLLPRRAHALRPALRVPEPPPRRLRLHLPRGAGVRRGIWPHTEVPMLVSHLPGYVSESLEQLAPAPPEAERPLDVGFRARPLAPYMGPDDKAEMGRGSRSTRGRRNRARHRHRGEPREPAPRRELVRVHRVGPRGARRRVRHAHLRPRGRGAARLRARRRGARGPGKGDPRRPRPRRARALDRRVRYRTIGPRHFEAAAMRVCQVLFEGSYSGLMEPMRHYIPVRRTSRTSTRSWSGSATRACAESSPRTPTATSSPRASTPTPR